MKEYWSYHKGNYRDQNGEKWHFVTCHYYETEIEYSERPIAFYFRNDARTYFGTISFEKQKENPYKFSKLAEKVMNNKSFRKECTAPETEKVWSKNWK